MSEKMVKFVSVEEAIKDSIAKWHQHEKLMKDLRSMIPHVLTDDPEQMVEEALATSPVPKEFRHDMEAFFISNLSKLKAG